MSKHEHIVESLISFWALREKARKKSEEENIKACSMEHTHNQWKSEKSGIETKPNLNA